MKASKTKNSKKASKKATKRIAKRELEESLSAKFKEVILSLGQDASKIGKDIKKASKQIAKKLADKFQDVKATVGDTLETSTKNSMRASKKALTTPLITRTKPVTKAERVVSKVTQANAQVKPKRSYTRRAVNPVTGQGSAAKSRAGSNISAPQSADKPQPGNDEIRNTEPTTVSNDSLSNESQAIERSNHSHEESNNI